MSNRIIKIPIIDTDWTLILSNANGGFFRNLDYEESDIFIRIIDTGDTAPAASSAIADTDLLLFDSLWDTKLELGGGPVDVYARMAEGTGSIARLA